MYKHYSIFAFLLFFLSNTLSGQSLEEKLNELMSLGNYPGFAVGIIKDQALVYEGYFGLSDIENNTPVSEETTYMLASVTKHITHCAVNMAWESGAISNINDPIANYLPFEVKNPSHPDDEISIAMLMDHTSSIKDSFVKIQSLLIGVG